VYRL